MHSSDAMRREKAELCVMNADAPHSQSSSPAKAGDPVFQSVRDGIEKMELKSAAFFTLPLQGRVKRGLAPGHREASRPDVAEPVIWRACAIRRLIGAARLAGS